VIDLHSHLLPAVDDGSRSVEQSVAVLQEMARHGIQAVCLTPHLPSTRLNRGIPERYDEAYAALLPEAPPLPRLLRGLEIMYDGPLVPEVARSRRGTIGGTRYILVEFRRMVSRSAIAHAVQEVMSLGLVPLIAHPERYRCCNPDSVAAWRALGARTQVDATTLLSSRPRGNRARALLAYGHADIMAADNHGDGRMISAAFQVLSERGGKVQAELLARENPRRLLEDQDLLPVPELPIQASWWNRIRAMFEHPGG